MGAMWPSVSSAAAEWDSKSLSWAWFNGSNDAHKLVAWFAGSCCKYSAAIKSELKARGIRVIDAMGA